MIHRESAEAYHARKAVSAGYLWGMMPPHGCPALAYARSVFNPDPLPGKTSLEFDIGQATHLLMLEGTEFAARTTLIPFETYQTAEARKLRDEAHSDGRTPLRPKDYKLVCALHDALRASAAADLLFGEGGNEVSYTWIDYGYEHALSHGSARQIDCKARADRITPHAIVDLKTVASASPDAFQRAIVQFGHHMRAAWYIDGWGEQTLADTGDLFGRHDLIPRTYDYLYVVVAKPPPHLVEIYPLEEGAIHKGRALYRKALALHRQGQQFGVWPGYSHRQRIGLPTYYEYQIADMVAEGELEL